MIWENRHSHTFTITPLSYFRFLLRLFFRKFIKIPLNFFHLQQHLPKHLVCFKACFSTYRPLPCLRLPPSLPFVFIRTELRDFFFVFHCIFILISLQIDKSFDFSNVTEMLPNLKDTMCITLFKMICS